MQISSVDPDRLTELAALAARCQADPESHVAYLSEDPEPIAVDVTGVDDWGAVTWTAIEGADLLGWILAEADDDLGRIWWWGPFVTETADWHSVADALLGHAGRAMAGFDEQEMVADSRSSRIPALAERHGFHREEGSLLLIRTLEDTWPLFHEVNPATSHDHPEIVALHDALFPNAHAPGRSLVSGDAENRILLAVRDGTALGGYLAAEFQNDGSLYIDFVGVAPERANRGFGRKLVATACGIGSEHGATIAHLSVRESNQAARALYRSLGFVEDRSVIPYRKGFRLS